MCDDLQYGIRVLIIHPTLTSEEISAALGLKSRLVKTVGQPRCTPQGKLTSGVWPDTRWSVWEIRNGDRAFFTRLDRLLDRFAPYRDFLRRVAETGGETNFIIELHGAENIGDNLTPEAVAKLADLKGTLGVEVFPDMNPEEQSSIWADDA